MIYALATPSINASPQNQQTKEPSAPKVQLSFIPNSPAPHNKNDSQSLDSIDIDIFNLKTKNNKTTTYIDFNKMKPTNKIKQIEEYYLTFYSRKREKLKATYLQGSYAINYTQNW